MSTQYISRTVPLSYRGYATCDRCAETYYPEQPGQTTCNLCAWKPRTYGRPEATRQYNADHRVLRGEHDQILPCLQCGVMYTPHPKASHSRYCGESCRRAYLSARRTEKRRAERKARNA